MEQAGETQPLFYYEKTNQLISVIKSELSYSLVKEDLQSVDKDFKIVIDKLPKYLSNDYVYILDSINSGTGRTKERNIYEKIIKPIFELFNIDHSYIATKSAGSIKEFAEQLKPEGTEITVIFISGDTSVSEFVNGLELIDSPSKLNIFAIPAGTGNSLALSLGLNNEVQALQKLFTGVDNAKPLNLFEASFPPGSYYLVQNEKKSEINQPLKFLVVLSWAFHASLVADSDTPELRKHGIERFKMAAYSNLSQEQKYEGFVKLDEDLIEGPFAYFVLTPAQRFEEAFIVSPKGNIFDENLFLVAFKSEEDTSGKYIMDIMGEIYDKGKHIYNDKVTYKEIQSSNELVIKTQNSELLRKRRFCLDGSIIALPETKEHVISVKPTGNEYKNWKLFVIS